MRLFDFIAAYKFWQAKLATLYISISFRLYSRFRIYFISFEMWPESQSVRSEPETNANGRILFVRKTVSPVKCVHTTIALLISVPYILYRGFEKKKILNASIRIARTQVFLVHVDTCSERVCMCWHNTDLLNVWVCVEFTIPVCAGVFMVIVIIIMHFIGLSSRTHIHTHSVSSTRTHSLTHTGSSQIWSSLLCSPVVPLLRHSLYGLFES